MIQIVANQLSADGMKFVRAVSDREVSEAFMRRCVPGAASEFASVKCYSTAALSLFYGEVTYPVRGVVKFQVPGVENRWRSFAAWRLMDGEGYRVSEVIEILANWFFEQTKRRPVYAFMQKLPNGIENGCDVPLGDDMDGVMLLAADWALEKCVMVGG